MLSSSRMNTDAVQFPENTVPRALSSKLSPELLQEISNNLTPTDVKKLYFLCLDLIPSGMQCPRTIEELLSFITCDVDTVALIKELLYHIKKYKLLKSLQTCKHMMERTLQEKKFVKEDRVSLFFVCENVESDHVEQLKRLFNENPSVTKGWEDVALEEFLSIWLRDIDDDKMQQLKEKLKQMNYNSLAEKLNSEERLYHVSTPSRGKPCGLAVIFNNETFNRQVSKKYKGKRLDSNLKERKGTAVDEEKLCKLWKSFGFDVIVFKDKTYPLMNEIIGRLVKLNYSSYSIFICCILTHGDRDKVYTSDNVGVNICDEIIYKFNSNDVPLLKKKPKIFFIQACQGNKVESVSIPSNSTLQMDSVGDNVNYSTNSMGDMIWALSAIPSHKSFRDEDNGSWFINSIVDIFSKYGTTKDVLQLINLVNIDVSRKTGYYENKGIVTQMPAFSGTTFHSLRLKRIEDPISELRRVHHLQNCPQHLQLLFELANAIYPL